jgi:hypothetical protein
MAFTKKSKFGYLPCIFNMAELSAKVNVYL